jgi:mRNA interferase MazF
MVKRGDVFWAELAPRSGSEQQGFRPVVIVSHDGFNRSSNWRSIIVVPLTSSATQAGRGPTAIALDAGTGGLDRKSTAICHQVTTLDRSKLDRKIGDLDRETLDRIDAGLKAAMNLTT